MFGDRDSGGYLPKCAWTKIVRHCMVTGTASPDDPDLAQYWAGRRRRNKPPLDNSTLRLIQAQHGCCPLCADYLLYADREPASPREWEQWLTATRKAITRHNLAAGGSGGTPGGTRLVHVSCYRREAQRGGYTPAEQQRRERLQLQAAGRFARGDTIREIARDLRVTRGVGAAVAQGLAGRRRGGAAVQGAGVAGEAEPAAVGPARAGAAEGAAGARVRQ